MFSSGQERENLSCLALRRWSDFVTSKPSNFFLILNDRCIQVILLSYLNPTVLWPVYLRKQYESLLHRSRVHPTLGLAWKDWGLNFVEDLDLILWSKRLCVLLSNSVISECVWKVRSDSSSGCPCLVKVARIPFFGRTVRKGGIGSSERLVDIHGMQGGPSFQIPVLSLLCLRWLAKSKSCYVGCLMIDLI